MPSVSETTVIPAPIDEVWPLLSDPALVASCIPGAQLAPDQSDDIWRGAIRVKFGPTVAAFRGEATLAYDHTAHTCSIDGKGIDQRGASRALASGVVKATPDGQSTKLDVNGDFSVTGPLETFANAGGVHVARALLGEFASNMAKMVAERGSSAHDATAQPLVSIDGSAHATEGAGTLPSPSTGEGPGMRVVHGELDGSAPPPTPNPSLARGEGRSTPATPVQPSHAHAPRPTTSAAPPSAAAEISGFRILWLAFKSWLSSLFGRRT